MNGRPMAGDLRARMLQLAQENAQRLHLFLQNTGICGMIFQALGGRMVKCVCGNRECTGHAIRFDGQAHYMRDGSMQIIERPDANRGAEPQPGSASEEAKNPQKDIPFGIIASLIVCTLLYIAIALVLTGLIPWDKLNVPDPLAVALQYIHADWAAGVLALGAVAAMTSVLLVFQLGQARIFMSMARDGLLPPWAAKVHPKYQTPHITTIITGIFVAISAAFAPIGWVLELTNIGTLFAFMLVAVGIIILRRREPDRPRPFRTPWVPVLPLVSIGFCAYLIYNLPHLTWLRFVLWMGIGVVIYFMYSVRHSRVRERASASGQRGG